MPRAIEVTLERDGKRVDRVERLPRRMPDGAIGVEFMGLVYPLVRAGHASLDGRWCYASEAPICLEFPELPPDQERRFWTLESSGTRPYLFIDGTEALLAEVLAKLAKSGVAVEHHGPSFRESETGLLHDWFIRLDPETALGGWELAQIFAEVTEPREAAAAPSAELAAARLRRDYERIASRLVDAERELAATLAAADRSRLDLQRVQDEAAKIQNRLETEAAFLRASVSALRNEGAKSDVSELTELSARIETLSADREEAFASWARSDEQVKQLRVDLEATQARLTEILSATGEAVTPTPRKRGKADADLQTLLKVLLPSIELVRGSVDFILTEVEDRRDLYSKLKLLADDPVALGGKRVHAVDGWLEVHMSTGRGRDGRVYYKKDGTDWRVLVSDKAAQANDLQWLKTQ